MAKIAKSQMKLIKEFNLLKTRHELKFVGILFVLLIGVVIEFLYIADIGLLIAGIGCFGLLYLKMGTVSGKVEILSGLVDSLSKDVKACNDKSTALGERVARLEGQHGLAE